MTHPTRYEALLELVERATTQTLLAEALGVSQPAVSGWINQSKQLPAEHVLTAERLFGVSRYDLRPDIYPRDYLVDRGGPSRFFAADRAA